MFCESSLRRNGQRERWEGGKEDLDRGMVAEDFKKIHCSCNPETLKRMLNMAKQ